MQAQYLLMNIGETQNYDENNGHLPPLITCIT